MYIVVLKRSFRSSQSPLRTSASLIPGIAPPKQTYGNHKPNKPSNGIQKRLPPRESTNPLLPTVNISFLKRIAHAVLASLPVGIDGSDAKELRLASIFRDFEFGLETSFLGEASSDPVVIFAAFPGLQKPFVDSSGAVPADVGVMAIDSDIWRYVWPSNPVGELQSTIALDIAFLPAALSGKMHVAEESAVAAVFCDYSIDAVTEKYVRILAYLSGHDLHGSL